MSFLAGNMNAEHTVVECINGFLRYVACGMPCGDGATGAGGVTIIFYRLAWTDRSSERTNNDRVYNHSPCKY